MGFCAASGDFESLLASVADGATLTEAEAEAAFGAIMSGGATHAQIATFLTALHTRGETVAEITGAARIMRAKALPIRAPDGAIDTCGTGGDGANTFNISTAVALVLAAADVPVAKHGNRAASSRSGAADVLAALGVNVEAPVETIERSLREINIGFLFAPMQHSAMLHVAPVRKELGFRTIFNLLGPLSNPAAAKRQLLGVFSEQWLTPLAQTLGNLGSDLAWIVHGSDGLDEITTTGTTKVGAMERRKDGTVNITTFEVVPEDAGVNRARAEDLKGGNPEHNATMLRALLSGHGGPYRDIVVLNSAAAFIVSGKTNDLKSGAEIALDTIMSGRAAKTLAGLVAISNGNATP